MRTSPPSPHSDILESTWTPEERRDLIRRVARATGMKLESTPARKLIGWLVWIAAIHAALCGLSLFLTNASLMAFAYNEATQTAIYAFTMTAAIFYPCCMTLAMGLRLNQWIRGLARREVILHLTMIPDFPVVIGQTLLLHWWSFIRRQILPFFLLGLGSAIIATSVIARDGISRSSGISWWRWIESSAPLWFVSSMSIVVSSPLGRGAVGIKRHLLGIIPVFLLAAPFWIPMVTLFMGVIRTPNLTQNPLPAILSILAVLHVTYLICLISYLRRFSQEWSATCRALSENT